jgi:hypothetical protein
MGGHVSHYGSVISPETGKTTIRTDGNFVLFDFPLNR